MDIFLDVCNWNMFLFNEEVLKSEESKSSRKIIIVIIGALKFIFLLMDLLFHWHLFWLFMCIWQKEEER